MGEKRRFRTRSGIKARTGPEVLSRGRVRMRVRKR